MISPALMQRLARSRLGARRAVASTGVGERRSRAKGAGIEFADHRRYQPGDDIRYLDRHLHDRFGEHFIRQFSLYQQLPITILLDASASMAYGQPAKFGFAAALVGALGYVGLAGGDLVRVAVYDQTGVHWFTPLHGARRAGRLFTWLEGRRPRGRADLPRAIRSLSPRLPPGGLLVIVSDWLEDGTEASLEVLQAARQELVAIQVLAPEELEPGRLGGGDARLVDAETGQEVELGLDGSTYRRYHAALEAWISGLKESFHRQQGLFLRARSDDDLEQLLLREWRSAGLIE